MQTSTRPPEQILDEALNALSSKGSAASETLDALPAPVYLTDAEGRITYYNEACVDFAGRRPALGEDRWCVTYRLYGEDGAFMPHDECPMAVAVRERRPVRGAEAIAERPDGTRRHFRPYPTPVFDEAGRFAGALNLLFDISARKEADHLSAQAKRCRRLARTIGDSATVATLARMAEEYEAKAGELGREA